MATKSTKNGYGLTVPLDVSGVDGFDKEKPIKVLVAGRKGKTEAQIVNLNASGKGTAKGY